MKERPILFKGAMVRALLNGTKTQTRRIVNPRPVSAEERLGGGYEWPTPNGAAILSTTRCPELFAQHCKHGAPGDRLWVKENFKPRPAGIDDLVIAYEADDAYTAFGVADGSVPDSGTAVYFRMLDRAAKRMNALKAPEVRPNIYLPRWACRLTLEITAVRVERLQDISSDDIIAEGVTYPVQELGEGRVNPLIRISGKFPPGDYLPCLPGSKKLDTAQINHDTLLRAHWASLWETVNGATSWAANPFVWVITFRKV